MRIHQAIVPLTTQNKIIRELNSTMTAKPLSKAHWLFCCLLLCLASPCLTAAPKLMLAETYDDEIVVSEYWVSEKLDGVRARWDGQQLISRSGRIFNAPTWFTAGFPDFALDGELWSERGAYQRIASITARQTPHEGWRELSFMLFDLPEHNGDFSARVAAMRTLTAAHLKPVVQFRLSNEAALFQRLDAVIEAGGEGLMLHHQAANYIYQRSNALLKLKRFTDAEATVIGYRPGRGKYAGMVGSLKVRDSRGKIFYVGSGLSDAERAQPPALGSRITFKHQGYTDSGIPRFPVFLRLRLD